VAVTSARSHGRLEHPRRLWVVGAIIVAAIGFLLAKGLGSSINYFETVNQAVALRPSLGTSTFRMEGVVVPGTVHQTSRGTDFSMRSHGAQVAVVGHFARGRDTFISNQIMVKHSANYIAAHPNRVKPGANGSS
jgi:cytochrome c-type biogenesis protein CcmE